MMQSAVSCGESIGTLSALHRITLFFTDNNKGKTMASHRTFLMQSPPTPKFSAFIRSKYQFHTFGYLLRPVMMESSTRRTLD